MPSLEARRVQPAADARAAPTTAWTAWLISDVAAITIGVVEGRLRAPMCRSAVLAAALAAAAAAAPFGCSSSSGPPTGPGPADADQQAPRVAAPTMVSQPLPAGDSSTGQADAAPASEPAYSYRPFHRGPDYQLRKHRAGITRKMLAPRSASAAVAPDGRTVATVKLPRGAEIRRVPFSSRPISLQVGDANHLVFSPDSQRLALVEDQKRIVVVRVDTGRIEHRLEARGPTILGFSSSSDELYVLDACVVLRFAVSEGVRTESLRPRSCSDVIAADGQMLVTGVRQRSRIVSEAYFRIDVLDFRTQQLSSVPRHPTKLILRPRVSLPKRRICYHLAEGEEMRLHCGPLTGAPATRMSELYTRRSRFDDTGDRLMVAAFEPDATIYVADFANRSLRRLGPMRFHNYRFLSGGQVLVGQDGARDVSTAYDLERGHEVPLGGSTQEWEGIFPAPEQPRTWVMGHDVGATRNLYWLQLR